MVHTELVIVPVIFGALASVLISRMHFRHVEKMASLQQGHTNGPESDARLMRVESAIEAIAVEVERIGEGQRFVTRILSERPALPLPISPPVTSARTPH